MSMLLNTIVLGFISFITETKGFGLNEKTWTYEIKSIETGTSNADLFNFNIQNERISRGLYAVSGEIFLNFDIVDDDGNTFAAKSFRSTMGNGDYKILPFQLQPIHWHKYLNSIYKDTIMESLKDCSNLPYIKDKFVPPIEKKKYTLTKCQFSQDGFPNHLQEGMYKLLAYGNGTVDWYVQINFEVQQII